MAAGPVPLASWPIRVAGYVVDHAVFLMVSLLGVLVFGVQPWVGSGVEVAVYIVQGITGATPGKWAVGIRVVLSRTLEPLGVWRSLARWVAHLLDWLTVLGWLRPIWHRQKRTFADSLVRSVAIVTRV